MEEWGHRGRNGEGVLGAEAVVVIVHIRSCENANLAVGDGRQSPRNDTVVRPGVAHGETHTLASALLLLPAAAKSIDSATQRVHSRQRRNSARCRRCVVDSRLGGKVDWCGGGCPCNAEHRSRAIWRTKELAAQHRICKRGTLSICRTKFGVHEIARRATRERARAVSTNDWRGADSVCLYERPRREADVWS